MTEKKRNKPSHAPAMSGEPEPGEDRREQFERWTQETPANGAARQAFEEARIAMILADASLTGEQKEEAVRRIRGVKSRD